MSEPDWNELVELALNEMAEWEQWWQTLDPDEQAAERRAMVDYGHLMEMEP